jgi:hypothetical protein
MMSGNTSDPGAETNLRQALERRTNETRQFTDWLYSNATATPLDGDTSNGTTTDNNNATFSLAHSLVPPDVSPFLQTFARQRGPESVHYHNISGFVKGQWEVHNTSSWYQKDDPSSAAPAPSNASEPVLSDPAPEPTGDAGNPQDDTASEEETPQSRRGTFPWSSAPTATERKATFNIRETDPSNDEDVHFVRGTLDLEVDNNWSVEVDVEGVQCVFAPLA